MSKCRKLDCLNETRHCSGLCQLHLNEIFKDVVYNPPNMQKDNMLELTFICDLCNKMGLKPPGEALRYYEIGGSACLIVNDKPQVPEQLQWKWTICSGCNEELKNWIKEKLQRQD